MSKHFRVRPAHVSLPDITAKFFQQDPFVASEQSLVGIMEHTFPGEACIGSGPTSARVAVVDYNADLDRVFAPAELLKTGRGFNVGRGNPAHNHKFHQVNVWAVVCRTLAILENEEVLGRRVPWAFDRGRLLILPHAGYWENAFYDRATGALHFFYFEDPRGDPVYTCLSHDIITHELGHAVLDGLKPLYNEVTSPATAGFHEYFGDAVAITASLTLRNLVVAIAGIGDGNLEAPNLIANIASQFGRAMSPTNYGDLSQYYLRTAQQSLTMADMEGVLEEHRYSEVLTGAFYDLLKCGYRRMLARRISESNKAKADGGMRVASLIDAADLTGRMMLRALDYCPPVDIDYLDYARAVVRADQVAYPLDEEGFRRDVEEIFITRGLCCATEELNVRPTLKNSDFRGLDVGALSASKTDAYDFLNANRSILEIPPTADFHVLDVYRTRKLSRDGYRPPQEIIVEFAWSEDVALKGIGFGRFSGASMPLWCGGTIVFSRDGNLLHYVLKSASDARREALQQYVEHLVEQQHISFDDGEKGLGARGMGGNRVTAQVIDGKLRMQRTAAFRHAGRGQR